MLDLNTNLLSVSKLKDRDISIASKPGFLDLVSNGKTLATAQRNGGSYVLELDSRNHPKETVFATRDSKAKAKDKAVTWNVLHARLAHVGDHFITKLPGVTEGLPQLPVWSKGSKKACDLCARSKQIRIISRDQPAPAKDPLERLYIDGWVRIWCQH